MSTSHPWVAARFRGVVAALVCCLLAPLAGAQEPTCLDCHADTADYPGRRHVVVAAKWEASVHAQVACADCHDAPRSRFETCPHERPETEPLGCVDCHEDQAAIQAEFDASAHAGTTLDCSTCHDVHELPAGLAELPRPERVAYANAKCQVCHNDTVYRVVGKTDAELPSTAHDWLPFPESHARIRCVVCHADTQDEHSHRILPKAQSTRSCEACHAEDAELIAKYVGLDDGSGRLTNPRLAEVAYVPGAVRNRDVDRTLFALAGLVLLGTALHGLLRVLSRGRRTAPAGRLERVRIYGLGLRLWHWANAALFLVLAVTGFRLHFGGRQDEPGAEGSLGSFETSFDSHSALGIAFLVLTALFYLGALVTGDWRQYFGRPRDGLRGVLTQLRYYLSGIFRGAPHPYHATPERRLNPLQQLAYLKVMYLFMPVVCVSGLVLLLPDFSAGEIAARANAAAPTEVEMFMGHPARWWLVTLHYLGSAVLVLFVMGHLYLATTGDRIGSLLRAMISGWHTHHAPAELDPADAGDSDGDA